jgi:predicted small metal-binding protein
MDERLTVRCVCGWETSGSTDEVVAATDEHGRRLHNMAATREQILAMAVRTDAVTATPAGVDGSGPPNEEPRG